MKYLKILFLVIFLLSIAAYVGATQRVVLLEGFTRTTS